MHVICIKMKGNIIIHVLETLLDYCHNASPTGENTEETTPLSGLDLWIQIKLDNSIVWAEPSAGRCLKDSDVSAGTISGSSLWQLRV